MHISVTEWVLSTGYFCLQLLLLGVMLVRKRKFEFPIFFNFIVFSAVTQILLLFAVNWSYAQLFYTYWSVLGLSLLLGFWVLYESLVQVMKPYSALADLAKTLFLWAGALLLAMSFLTALATGGSPSDKLCAAILLLNRCIQLMQCGLLFFFLVFEKRLGASWCSPGVCVALGLGVSAALHLSTWYLIDHFPAWRTAIQTAHDLLNAGVPIYWSLGMIRSTKRTSVQDAPNRLILKRPGVEQAVERVLSRKMLH